MPEEEKVKELIAKYKQELGRKLTEKQIAAAPVTTKEYQEFKKEFMPAHMTLYEKMCNLSEKIFKLKPDAKTEPKIQESISICHLNITPTGSVSFAYLGPLIFILIC